jgi:hypothetical protein
MNFLGSYCGIVEDNKDPEKLGRIKARVAHVYGAVGGTFGAVPTESIPWAIPAGLPNGQTHASGGCDWIPETGDQILVRFLDGEPEKPVYEWLMQTQESAKSYKLHQYADLPTGGVGKPKRGAWERYGHTVEWNDSGLILTTARGYRVMLTDASEAGFDGDVYLSTQAGQFLHLDDSVNTISLNTLGDYHINVADQMLAMCDSISLQSMTNEIEMVSGSYISMTAFDNLEVAVGADYKLDVTGSWNSTVTQDFQLSVTGTTDVYGTGDIGITSPASITLEFGNLFIGTAATEPFVLGTQLMTYLTQMYTILLSHTHAGVMSGPSVTATMIPVPPMPPVSLLSETITGR